VDRWHAISEFHGVKSRNIALGFTILRSPKSRQSEVALKSQTRTCIGVSANRDSGVGEQVV
jgi:hypothetical protein